MAIIKTGEILGRDEQALTDLTQDSSSLLQDWICHSALAPNKISVFELQKTGQIKSFSSLGSGTYIYHKSLGSGSSKSLDEDDTEPKQSFSVGSIWDLQTVGKTRVLVRREGGVSNEELSAVPESVLLDRYYHLNDEAAKRELLLSEQSVLNKIEQEFKSRGILDVIKKGRF